ncbi:serine/threonine-protein kinase [Kitasatospora sp. NPDC058965]|uniref:serine/threonine-protein kinase n=1 Tax=Kitasatospora sp. NPDC058965 TaxID=3346682 RepID=UPI0036BFCE54
MGPYRLLGRLGAGGMGQVYLGRSPGGRTVAVKRVRADLAADAEFLGRFRREVAAARKVGGAWTAPVLDADTESAEPWVATGYVAGPALQDAVAEFGPLDEQGVRALVAGLAEALGAVHGLGLIHRDIKPSNVMLSPQGPVLIDFGIARALDGSGTAGLTQSGYLIGSPGYMSPEQVEGRPLGAASDVFQLGAVLVFAATRRGPFHADSAATLLYLVAHGEPELGSMHGELREIAAACLAKDPTLRPTPAQLAARLAPQGARGLLEQGWLTAPLLAQISRRMAELLDLDAAVEEVGTRRLSAERPAHPPTARGTGAAAAPPRDRVADLLQERTEQRHAEQNRVADVLGRQQAQRTKEEEREAREQARRERWALQDEAEHRRVARRRNVLATLGTLAITGTVVTAAYLGNGGSASKDGGQSSAGTVADQALAGFYGDWQGTLTGSPAGTVKFTVARPAQAGATMVTAVFVFDDKSSCRVDYGTLQRMDSRLTLGRGVGEAGNGSACTQPAVTLDLGQDGTLEYAGTETAGTVRTALLSKVQP